MREPARDHRAHGNASHDLDRDDDRPIGVTCDIGSVEWPEGLFADRFE